MNTTILALDPGRTTGICIAKGQDTELAIAYTQEKLDHVGIFQLLDDLMPDYVICESFEFRQGKQIGIDLYPCELIGVVKLWKPEVYMQTAAQGKGYYDNDKLKELGLYRKGVQHGRDACRHMLYWLHFGPGARFRYTIRNGG